MKYFNTAGPCNPDDHYMLPALDRLRDENMERMIAQKNYFVVHAPRQTGKTTTMLTLAQTLTQSGLYAAVLVSMEVGAAFPTDIEKAERAILSDWQEAIQYQLPPSYHPSTWYPPAEAGRQLSAMLAHWAAELDKPLVIFLDEIDALENSLLISVLRQLRSGYSWRPNRFPASLALIGLRDVRDYKVAAGGTARLSTPSPFNIAVRAIVLRNFTREETTSLLNQHQQATGQSFTPEAASQVFALSQGQPWLVNALAKVAVEELVPDLSQPITIDHIEVAKTRLIERRQTHLDQLTDKLQQTRIRRVIEPILAGGTIDLIPQDDLDYVIDLGLCRFRPDGGLEIANPIYQAVIPRALSYITRASLPQISPTWLTETGELDLQALQEAFLTFWRQHGQPLLRTAPYHEIAPHLVMMAFLDRVVNGGGTLSREYAIGSDRMDLYLQYGPTQLAIELKVWRAGRNDPLANGLAQLDTYLNGLNLDTGWLVIFDQRDNLPPIGERIGTEAAQTPAGRTITVIRA